MTKVAAIIRPTSLATAIEESRFGIEAGADAIMVDLCNWPTAERTVNNFRRLIASAGHQWMFCLYEGDLEEISRALLSAAEGGADYVDIPEEYLGAAKAFGAKVILSRHYWERAVALDEAKVILEAQRVTGADVVKLVARMDTEAEFVEAKRVMAWLRDEFTMPWIYLGVGKYGFEQRFLGCEYGCAVTFALREHFSADDAQPLINDFRLRFKTKI